MRSLHLRTANRVEELPYGLAFFEPDLPAVWDLNLIWIDELPGDMTAAELAADAERVQGPAGLAHRRIELNTEGDRLAEGFAAIGWKHDRLVVMAHRARPDRKPGDVVVKEIDAEAARSFSAGQLLADPEGFSDDVIRQIAEHPAMYARAGARFFGIEADGEIVSTLDLYLDGPVAQLESILTLEAYRSRGYASSLVLHGLGEAVACGASLVFIQAEEDDWPKALYTKLGWVPIGRTSTFTRHPPA